MYELEMLIQESEDNVMEALLRCLDKADMMLEYAGYGNPALDEYVSEMFELFMESTARRKKADEIDAYMKKHNWGDVNSKTPAQAKKARALRNFLIMQDFDPKTGTIKSDVDGHRVKFNINNANGSYYKPSEDLISIENRNKHQAERVLTLQHEKGHNKFYVTGQSYQWARDENPKERGIKHIRQAIDSGKEINSHDDGSYLMRGQGGEKKNPEEIEADLHAAKTARMRTKYAGRKRAVKRSGAARRVNDKEIERWYVDMQKSMKMGSMLIDNKIKNNYKMLQGIRFIDQFKEAVVKIKSGKQFYQYLKSVIEEYTAFCKSINIATKKEYSSTDRELIINIKRIKELMHNKNMAEIDIKNSKESLDKYKKELEDYPDDEFLKRSVERRADKLNEAMSKLNDILKEIESYAEAKKTDLYKLQTFKGLLIDEYENFDDEFEDLPDYEQNDYSDKLKELKQNLSLFDEVKSVVFSNTKLAQYKKEYDKARKEIEKSYRDRMRELKDVKPNDSTQMRHDFVKKYVHECFEEFMMEYYSYENVFGVYMED